MNTPNLETLRTQIPDAAKDIRLNLQGVLGESSLSPAQRWGTAVASALAARHEVLSAAVIAEAAKHVDRNVIEDGVAAASLMAMNNVFYRFRHMLDKPAYLTKPARLRMNRIAQPATNKLDFELFCLAVSAVNGCEACLKAHEKVVTEGGLSEDNVVDAVRIAATLHAAATALEARASIATALEAAQPVAV